MRAVPGPMYPVTPHKPLSTPFHVFHHEERAAFVLIEGADVGMVEPCRGTSLLLKASLLRIGGGRFRGQKLDRYLSLQPRVVGQIDHTHATRAELGGEVVMSYGLADHDKISRNERPYDSHACRAKSQ